MKRSFGSLGLLLLGIYLVLRGLTTFLPIHIPGMYVIEGLLALIAGILLILGR
jgi:hypothetical protein